MGRKRFVNITLRRYKYIHTYSTISVPNDDDKLTLVQEYIKI